MYTVNQEEQVNKKLSQLIAKCWADEGFKQKLLADPAAALKGEGVGPPAGLSIKALEDTDKVFHLVIPAKPSGNLSDEDLDKVAGGAWYLWMYKTGRHGWTIHATTGGDV